MQPRIRVRDMRAWWNTCWSREEKEEILCQAGIAIGYATTQWDDLKEEWKSRIISAAKDLRYIK